MITQVPIEAVIRETLLDGCEGSVPILWFPLFNRLLNEHGLRFRIKHGDEHALVCAIERTAELQSVTVETSTGRE